jgi:hypothetical protein
MNEGVLAGCYHVYVINPVVCVHCRAPLTPGPVYALGAPYHAVIHRDCLPYFPYTGRYPHDLPAMFYDRQPTHSPLRTSHDDNGFVALRR